MGSLWTLVVGVNCRRSVFNQVIAIEKDSVRIQQARHNAEIYGVSEHISFINADFFDVAPWLQVTFPPPPKSRPPLHFCSYLVARRLCGGTRRDYGG